MHQNTKWLISIGSICVFLLLSNIENRVIPEKKWTSYSVSVRWSVFLSCLSYACSTVNTDGIANSILIVLLVWNLYVCVCVHVIKGSGIHRVAHIWMKNRPILVKILVYRLSVIYFMNCFLLVILWEINFNGILAYGSKHSHFNTKICFEISSAKWRPVHLSQNVMMVNFQ